MGSVVSAPEFADNVWTATWEICEDEPELLVPAMWQNEDDEADEIEEAVVASPDEEMDIGDVGEGVVASAKVWWQRLPRCSWCLER